MKRFYILVCLSLFFATSFTIKDNGLKQIFTTINEDVLKNGRAYETLGEASAKIGHRLTGSPNGKQAEDYALQLLKSYGYKNARFQEFNVEAWSRDTVSLTLVPENSDNFVDFEVVALAHSPVSSHITGKIVDAGDGLESDFEAVKDEMKDKVVLFNINIQQAKNKGQKNLHRSEKTALAIKYGAKGVIIANAVEGEVLLTGTASVTGDLIPIPAVCVSVESGKSIRKWIKDEKNILAVIDMMNFSRPIKARNVIATHLGTSKKHKNEKIVVGGHLDSWDLATGAIDNGVGSFSVMDVARVFKSLNLQTKRPIEFVLFMGEEQGLLGSKHMVKELEKSKEINKVKLMMNLDMVNNARGFNAGGNDKLKTRMEEIGRIMQAVDTTYANAVGNGVGLHSDHQPFMLSGVPISSPSGTFPLKAYGCYHANCDRFELIDKNQINNNVRYAAMMLYALANEETLPVKNRTSNETKEFLIKHNLKNELIIGNEWKWEK
jgi:carboxypeptidase Q